MLRWLRWLGGFGEASIFEFEFDFLIIGNLYQFPLPGDFLIFALKIFGNFLILIFNLILLVFNFILLISGLINAVDASVSILFFDNSFGDFL